LTRVVLDASALMTFLEDRPGAQKVEELIGLAVGGKRELLMSVVNWGEVYYSVWRVKGPGAAKTVAAEIEQLPIQIVDADIELTKLAAEFRAKYKLPYADCFAAAVAKQHKGQVATSDRDFSLVEAESSLIWI
jgi:predicted nucleic acid-binding protein